MKKVVLLAFVLVFLSLPVVVGFVRPVADSLSVYKIDSGKVIAQTGSTTMVYLDPATINGTEIGIDGTVTVNIKISDAVDIYSWQAGLVFDATPLECLDFNEGEFLSDAADPDGTFWIQAPINNTAGLIEAHGCSLQGDHNASGDGRLAYLTFRVKELGVSDLHLRDVMVMDYYDPTEMVSFNIVDVYTVIVNATAHKVVTVSNSTGNVAVQIDKDWVIIHSGFYDHVFNASAEEISFKVEGPYPGFANVTIPKALLEPEPMYGWGVIIDGLPASRTVTENATHTSIHFTYSLGIHSVQITKRFIPSTISIALSQTSIYLGENVTISGAIDPLKPFVNLTIQCRRCGGTWTKVATVTTDWNSNYSYIWTLEKAGFYGVMASWEGDETTLGAFSDVWILTVLGPGLVYNINTTLVYCTIQEAIDAPETLDGHTIFVEAGTYYEHVVVNKEVSLIGENKYNTIIDGNGTGTVVYVTAQNTNVSGFTIRNGGMYSGIQLMYYSRNNIWGNVITNNTYGIDIAHYSNNNSVYGNGIANNDVGIWLSHSSNNSISGNNITANNLDGIWLWDSSNNNSITKNNITDNDYGIRLQESSNNVLRSNSMANNRYNFGVWGTILSDFVNDVDASNTVDDKPTYYLISKQDMTVPPDAGYVALVNCTRITVQNLNITNNNLGILLAYTTNSTINKNNVKNNYGGILLYRFSNNNSVSGNNITNNTLTGIGLSYSSNNNSVYGNNIADNDYGIWLWDSSNNSIYHNNFVDNTIQVYSHNSTNVWDDGAGKGNYWSDYEERYPNATELDESDIWDTPYVIGENNQDNYPIVPEFPTWTSMLLILIALTVAIVIYKRRLLKTPTH